MTTMTDRELLELSARAAGVVGEWCDCSDCGDGGILSDIGVQWNPLTDDGDAFRLAVKLGLLVDADIEEGESDVIASGVSAREPHGHNPCAATRRAIVRAAAAIGAKS